MTENVNIDISGEINVPDDQKRGFQKYVNDIELLMQHVRSGAGPALLMGFLSSGRPWTQFVAPNNFKTPASVPRLSRRFYHNLEYFQANYLFVSLILFAYCLITSPILLIAMVASFFGFRKLTSGPNNWKVGWGMHGSRQIGGWEVSKTQQYAVAAGGSMVVCWLAGAAVVLFWVLGATVTVVALHASLYDAEALQDPEQYPLEQV